MKPVIIIAIAFVLLIPIPVFAEVEFSKFNFVSSIGQLEVDEKHNRLFFLGQYTTLGSADIDGNELDNVQEIQFQANMIGYDYNAVTQKIYLFDQSHKNINVIDPTSLQIIDEIEDDWQPNEGSEIRQRDILVNDNTNKIYLLLESYVDISYRSQLDQKYRIHVYDGASKNLIKIINLDSTANNLLLDKSRNLVYAIDGGHQQYFIIDDNENLTTVQLPLSNQYTFGVTLDETNNQMFLAVGNRQGQIHEFLVVDAESGNEIQSIDTPLILSDYPPLISEKHQIIFFKTTRDSLEGLTIMDIEQGKNQIIGEVYVPDLNIGYLWLVDDTNDKLYAKFNDGFSVFNIPSLLSSLQSELEPEPEPVKTADDQYKIICSGPDGYCMEKYGMNNPDSYGECLGTWVPFCQTYEAKQPEPEPVSQPEISQEVEIICGKGTVLIDHICQVEQIVQEEKEIPVEKTVEIPVEKPTKKSVNWFSSIFDWFGGLFK